MTPLAVYIHFPWCLRKCPYCDFATRRIEPGALPHRAYADAVIAELGRRAEALEGRRLHSVFFGGGTPSLWAPAELGRVLEATREIFDGEEDLEVTAECNPSSLDETVLTGFREVGINRVSVGVQSLSDSHLTFLGRLHDSATARERLALALQLMPRVSADLMFGVATQSTDEWAEDLEGVLGLGLRHMSAYALTIEPGTQFGTLHRKGRLPVATEESYADKFELAERRFAEAGLAHYEVSNYAVPGEESRHNAHYWRGGEYLGLGAAAVGCLFEGPGRAVRYRNSPEPERYLGMGREEVGMAEREELDGPTLMREAFMLGLRTREGIDLRGAEARCGVDPLEGRRAPVERALANGELELREGFLSVPLEHWLRLDGIVARLF
ncbi:MAG: radical SAM family heme chaperone HemW [Myxococcota bacterium]